MRNGNESAETIETLEVVQQCTRFAWTHGVNFFVALTVIQQTVSHVRCDDLNGETFFVYFVFFVRVIVAVLLVDAYFV